MIRVMVLLLRLVPLAVEAQTPSQSALVANVKTLVAQQERCSKRSLAAMTALAALRDKPYVSEEAREQAG